MRTPCKHPPATASPGTAVISPCGTYRYVLTRRIPSVLRWVRPCLFVMLNPSKADASVDDPTIRRCIAFAKRAAAMLAILEEARAVLGDPSYHVDIYGEPTTNPDAMT